MSDAWLLTMKPSFLAELQALPPKEFLQVHKKLSVLTEDPMPDGKQKKRLEHFAGKLCRIRSGDYRIFYTFEKPYVSLLSVRLRDEKTYGDDIEGESLGGLDGELPPGPPRGDWARFLQPGAGGAIEKKPLPRPITEALLRSLLVPDAYFAKLLPITTEDDLLNVTGVPDELLLRIDQAVVERPLADVLAQRDLVAYDVDDLVKFKEGELLGFLLKLSPEQEKFVDWAIKASGPTLLKGGPGTGKSTVAMYRVRAMIAALRKKQIASPRILFTTYTNALVKSSEQQLASLLGPDAGLVEVRTADHVATALVRATGRNFDFAKEDQLRTILEGAMSQAHFAGNSLQQRAQAQAITRLGRDYLLEEILGIIEARRLATLEQYQAAKRPGRNLSLNKTQREGVWRVAEAFHAGLAKAKLTTWQKIRAEAAELAIGGEKIQRYEGVVVDEAQDLDPSVLQMLVGLCKEPNRLFLTADANQSIYGAGFRWQDVHDDLRFTGRTGVLRANYRSTREIGEAAQAYLTSGELDDERAERAYVNNGPTPAVRAVGGMDDEVKLLARYLRSASRELRLSLGACAVLVPSEKAGRRIAEGLSSRDVAATYMPGKELDLERKGVKIITLKSAKGLEFPIVALAGFLDGPYPWVGPDATPEEREEELARERRTMFVAMTRAMRALLVVLPSQTDSPLLAGFEGALWNLGSAAV